MQLGNLKATAARAALCAIPLCAGAAVCLLLANQNPPANDLLSAIDRPQLPEEMHLYKGDFDATGKPVVLADHSKLIGKIEGGRMTITDEMVTNKDGSLVLTKLVPEAVGTTVHHKVSTREYFPHQAEEDFWRLHSESLFETDGVTLKQDQVFHLTGTAERVGWRHDDGAYEITTYYDDGETVKLKRLTPPNADQAEPVREEQFRRRKRGITCSRATFSTTTAREHIPNIRPGATIPGRLPKQASTATTRSAPRSKPGIRERTRCALTQR